MPQQINCKRRIATRQILSFIAEAFRQIASKLKVIEIASFIVLSTFPAAESLLRGNKNVESLQAKSLHRATKKVDIFLVVWVTGQQKMSELLIPSCSHLELQKDSKDNFKEWRFDYQLSFITEIRSPIGIFSDIELIVFCIFSLFAKLSTLTDNIYKSSVLQWIWMEHKKYGTDFPFSS